MDAVKRTVLVVDDDPAYRNAAAAVLKPVLPADWRVEAPSKLDGALVAMQLKKAPTAEVGWMSDKRDEDLRQIEREVAGSVRVALIDNSLAGHNYQEFDQRDENDNSYRGWQLAASLKNSGRRVKIVAFSKNGHSSIESVAHPDATFAHKEAIHKPGEEGEKARRKLAEVVGQLVDAVEKEDAEVCQILELFQRAVADAVESQESVARRPPAAEEVVMASR